MDTNLKLETPLTEDQARAKYTNALNAFNRKCTTVEELRKELEEESIELTRLKGEVDKYSGAFLRAVERQEMERKSDMPEAYDKADAVAEAKNKAESRTVGKITGRTEDAKSVKTLREEGAEVLAKVLPRAPKQSKPHCVDTKPMFTASGTRPEIAPDAPAYAAQEVTEADRDETAIAAEDDEAELAIPSPGQRRAENITELSAERQAEAEDILETVDNILSND
jgi:dsDNA-specific endonuclease/ATPase MutS2